MIIVILIIIICGIAPKSTTNSFFSLNMGFTKCDGLMLAGILLLLLTRCSVLLHGQHNER